MIDLENFNFSNLSLYNNEFITYWKQDNEKSNFTYIDSFEYNSYKMNKEEVFEKSKIIYDQNKNDDNKIFINFLIFKDELNNVIKDK